MTDPGQREDVPVPICKNTNRRTAKCRRMCCRRQSDRVIEQDAPGKQASIWGNYIKQGWHYRKFGEQ